MAIANNQIETNENKNKEKEVKQYIVVQIGSEKYGIDISYVDNIVRMQKITRVPKAQEYFKGSHQSSRRNCAGYEYPSENGT